MRRFFFMMDHINRITKANCVRYHHERYFPRMQKQNIVCQISQWSKDDMESIENCYEFLKNDGVIAIPTDTIYGLACLLNRETAVQRIYNIKKRDAAKPVAICVDNINEISKWANIPNPALIDELLPGPVTVVLKRKQSLFHYVNPGIDLIGIRIPDYSFIQRLCERVCQPLVLTSANISLGASSLCIQDFKELWGEIDLIADGGSLGEVDPLRLGSTVVNLSIPGEYHIIREGCALRRTIDIVKKFGLHSRPTS